MIRKVSKWTCWTAMVAYLLQVLVMAQGGVLCFGAASPDTRNVHSHASNTGHCHSHGPAEHDHHHSEGHRDAEWSKTADADPQHCPCAHMHVSAKLGRTGDRVQLVNVKTPVASYPAFATSTPPALRAIALVQRGFYEPPLTKQTTQIIRSTVLLI